MKKMSIADAAEYFGVSREAIHNRIRRGSLEVVVEDDVKLVLLDESVKAAPSARKANTRKTNVSDERYHKLLEEQNAKLQARVEVLENETRTLRDQKELMLIEERKKIEQIYKEKDEQLKNILSTISSQFMLSTSETPAIEEIQVESVDAEIDVEEELVEPKVISLKKYIKGMNLSEKKIRKITEKFHRKAQDDERIITLGSKIYLDTSRYDYSDLFKK